MGHRVVGLVGLPGSGKSEVARILSEAFGALVVDGDRLGHEALAVPEIAARVKERFGREVIGPDGAVDRKGLGRIVFADESALEDLEALLHPVMTARAEALVTEAREANRPAVLDAAVLFEMGWDAWCDEVWLVDAPRSVRLERLRERGWNDEDVRRREERLPTIEEWRRRCCREIDNGGDRETCTQVAQRKWKEGNDATEKRR